MRVLRLGVLASGSGTNLQAFIDRTEAGNYPAKITIVVSDRQDAGALERAAKHSLPTEVISPHRFPSKWDLEARMIEVLRSHNVDLVVLAGFMRILSSEFVRTFPGRIMNIHPSLLPAFPGVHGIRDALTHGVKVTGCTVHFVDEGVDTGPIILQAPVEIEGNDTEETLLQKAHQVEHRIYPEAVRLFAEGKLRIEGRRVRILS